MRELLPLLVIGGGFAFTASLFYGAWLLGRYRGRDDEVHPDIATLESRLRSVEYAMSQTASALDRLEASHRQMAILITDPKLGGTVRLPARTTTPH